MPSENPVIDRERRTLIRIGGVAQTLGGLIQVVLLLVASPDPARDAQLITGALTLLIGVAVLAVPVRHLVADRRWDALIVLWTGLGAGLTAGIVVDRGTSSSITAFFLVVALAGMVTSAPAAALITAVDVAVAGAAFLLAPDGSVADYVTLVSSICISAAFCRWRLHVQRRQAAHLTEISETDPLTGVPNRRGFETAVDAAIAAHGRGELAGFTLVTVDLDRFKAINDTLGHAGGDAVLRRVATAMAGALRTGDHVGRLGGDEFAALLLGADRPSSGPLARIDAALELEDVAASLGSAHFPTHAPDAQALQHVADLAMYAVKRGRVAV